MGFGGGVVAVSAYMVGTCGSGVLYSACDVLEMSVMRGVGGMCMCLARGGVGGEWGEDWVCALPILEEHGESGKVCFGCGGVGVVGGSG